MTEAFPTIDASAAAHAAHVEAAKAVIRRNTDDVQGDGNASSAANAMVMRYHQTGGPDVMQAESIELPAPGPGQVLLRHHAIGVNFIDTMFRQGVFPLPLPAVTGVEGAGTAQAVGPGVTGIAVGDRVAYFLAPGAYASARLVDANALVRLPDDITFEQAATVLTKGLTAWTVLNGFHRLRAGQTVLVQGASSSVGGLVARWAKALGATVIGTAGSSAKRAQLEPVLDHVLASDDPALADRVRRLVPGGVDVVVEFVGRATFDATVRAVRDGGVIVNIGAASGAPLVDQDTLAARGVRITGGPMAQHLAGPARDRAVAAVFDAFRHGVFGELRAERYPLAQAARAHADIAARRGKGPMVLVP